MIGMHQTLLMHTQILCVQVNDLDHPRKKQLFLAFAFFYQEKVVAQTMLHIHRIYREEETIFFPRNTVKIINTIFAKEGKSFCFSTYRYLL